MGMTVNLCKYCTNTGCELQSCIVRTACVFYMPPHLEPDNCGNYIVMQPTTEARLMADREKLDSLCSTCNQSCPQKLEHNLKVDYERRLNADMIDTLEKLKKKMNLIKEAEYQIYGKEHWNFVGKCQDVCQQKINKLKGEEDGTNEKTSD